MELRLIIKALKKAEQTHKEQQAFWEAFEEIWPTENKDNTEYCLHNDVDEFIINKIEKALDETDGNRTHAAKQLGIKRETLLAKIKRYSLNCHKS